MYSTNLNNNNYFRINHKKSLEFFDTSSFAQLKSLLFCELSEIDTTTIGSNIITLFNSIIKFNNYKDKMKVINNISEQYIKNYDDSLSFYLCQKLSKKNFKMVFTISKDSIDEVAILLSIGLQKINKQKNNKNNKNKVFINYDKYIESLGKYKNMRLNMIPFYKNYSLNIININDDLIIQKYDIPNELLLLMDIFQKIKKLVFKIGDYPKEVILGILLILLNYKWLFPYVFEIEFDLTFIDLHKDIQKIYLHKINEKMRTNENINKIKNNIYINDEEKNQNKNIDNVNIQKYSIIFELIIIYIYFFDKFNFLNNLIIKMPNSFKKEIENHFNSQKISVPPPHPMELFFTINNLIFLKIEFNALDSQTFENIFPLIQNNSNLKILSLNFFPNEQEFENFNSLSHLLKLTEENSNDNNLIRKKEIKLNNNYNENQKELKNMLLNQLAENFESNMEKLFILLQTKKNLEELILIFNEPNILLDNNENDDFYLILLKFIYNILIMIDKENLLLKSIKINSKNFLFDNNKNNSIYQFLNGINLNEKNRCLINFELHMNINNVVNISNLISFNFKKMYLGEIDKITLNNFVTFYKSKKFIENSQIFSFTIELNESITSYKECKDLLIELIKADCPKQINEIGIFCKFSINENEIGDLVINGNKNCVHKYIFKIKGKNNDKKIYDKIIQNKKLYYIDKNFRKSINRYMGIIMKFKFYKNEKAKIGKKLFQFLVPSNRKTVDIYFI